MASWWFQLPEIFYQRAKLKACEATEFVLFCIAVCKLAMLTDCTLPSDKPMLPDFWCISPVVQAQAVVAAAMLAAVIVAE